MIAWLRREGWVPLLLIAVCLPPFLPMLQGNFWGGDDWVYLEEAQLVASGHVFDGFARHFSIHRAGEIQAGLRQVAVFFWGIDLLVWGPRAAGFFLTNVLLLMVTGGLAYTTIRRLTGSRLGAFAGAAVFLLNPRTAQVGWYLAARSETLGLLFCLAMFLVWTARPTAPRAMAWSAFLFLLAVFSKSTAIFILPVLFVWSLLHRGVLESLDPRSLLRGFGPPAAVVALYVGLVGYGRYLGGAFAFIPPPPDGVPAALGRVPGQVANGLLFPISHLGAGEPWFGVLVLIKGVLLLLCVIAALGWRRARGRATVLALVWVAAGLALPLPMLLGGADHDRYYLPSSVGLSLLVATVIGALATRERLGRLLAWVMAAALVVLSLAVMVGDGTAGYAPHRGRSMARLIDALRARVADGPPFDTAYVSLHSPGRELLSLLQRERALEILVPGLDLDATWFFFSGGDRRYQTDYSRFGDSLPGLDQVEEKAAFPDLRVLAQGPNPVFATTADDDGVAFQVVEASALAPRANPPPSEPVGWRLNGAANGWRLFGDDPRAPRLRPTPTGLALPPAGPLPADSVDVANLREATLLSPEIDLGPGDWCRLDLRFAGTPMEMPPSEWGAENLNYPHYALVLIEGTSGPNWRVGNNMYVPITQTKDGLRATAHLETAPTWALAGRIKRIAVAPMNIRDARLLEVRLVPCGASP